MNLKETMAKLESLGDEGRREWNVKSGAPKAKTFGVQTGDIRALAKKIKANHELALELWKTGNIDAQLLAILLMKPRTITTAEIDKMVRAATFVWVADWFNAYIVKEQPVADKEMLRIKWMEDKDAWAARAGWNLTASRIARSAKEAQPAPKGAKAAKRATAVKSSPSRDREGAEGDALDLPALLDRIESEMAAAPPEAQWTMNAVLANIGIHDATLRKRAIAIGEKLGIYRDYPCSKGCTSPFAPIWITAMVKRQG
ncbi:DNA alkylation repair enzyme [Phycisphaerae bacterium RAS1]|nr:DNA alkylation repair enzyme [Phycisphaerae bacterium RAS1]